MIITKQRLREIFAEELEGFPSAVRLAEMVRKGTDNSAVGEAAIRAMIKACRECGAEVKVEIKDSTGRIIGHQG